MRSKKFKACLVYPTRLVHGACRQYVYEDRGPLCAWLQDIPPRFLAAAFREVADRPVAPWWIGSLLEDTKEQRDVSLRAFRSNKIPIGRGSRQNIDLHKLALDEIRRNEIRRVKLATPLAG